MDNFKKKFSKIYDQYVEQIYRFVFLKVSSQEIAQDICSEVFLRSWQAFEVKNKEIKNIRAFLYRIAKNLVTDFYRKKAKERVVFVDDPPEIPDPQADIEKKVMINSDFEIVRKALLKINDDYQTVIIWHYLDGLKTSEIAKILNRPEGTIRVMLHRGLKELKNEAENCNK